MSFAVESIVDPVYTLTNAGCVNPTLSNMEKPNVGVFPIQIESQFLTQQSGLSLFDPTLGYNPAFSFRICEFCKFLGKAMQVSLHFIHISNTQDPKMHH